MIKTEEPLLGIIRKSEIGFMMLSVFQIDFRTVLTLTDCNRPCARAHLSQRGVDQLIKVLIGNSNL